MGAVLCVPLPVGAQEASEPPPAQREAAPSSVQPGAEERVHLLEQRLVEVERAQARARERASQQNTVQVIRGGAGGFALRSADEAFELTLRGYIQLDARAYADTGNQTAVASTLLVRRARPIVEGWVFRRVGFKIMPDFGSGQAVLQDAFVDLKLAEPINFLAGKYKPPLGLERLQSARNLTFVERGLTSNLVPNRDVGIQAYGSVAEGIVQYAVGVFDGVTDYGLADGDTNDDKDGVVRLFFHPLRRLSQAGRFLGLGVAGSYGGQAGTVAAPNLPIYRTPGQLAFFTYAGDGTANGTVIASGGHTRVVPQGYYYFGPLGVLGEAVLSWQNVRKGADVARLEHTAWQVQVSCVLFGGVAAFEGVRPRDPAAPPRWGALELAARYGEQTIDAAAFPLFADSAKSASQARGVTAGANWYINPALKLNLDLERVDFTGGGAPTHPPETSLLARSQVVF